MQKLVINVGEFCKLYYNMSCGLYWWVMSIDILQTQIKLGLNLALHQHLGVWHVQNRKQGGIVFFLMYY